MGAQQRRAGMAAACSRPDRQRRRPRHVVQGDCRESAVVRSPSRRRSERARARQRIEMTALSSTGIHCLTVPVSRRRSPRARPWASRAEGNRLAPVQLQASGPRVEAQAPFVAQVPRQPIRRRDAAARPLFADTARVRLGFPGTIHAPYARQPSCARGRKAQRDARPLLPPTPARVPELALAARAHQLRAQLAVDDSTSCRLPSRPLHPPAGTRARPRRPPSSRTRRVRAEADPRALHGGHRVEPAHRSREVPRIQAACSGPGRWPGRRSCSGCASGPRSSRRRAAACRCGSRRQGRRPGRRP